MEPLVARVRALLPDRPTLREVAMFGGRSIMVEDRMVVSVTKSGDMLVRVDPGRGPDLAELPGAEPATMGPQRRSMGPGWVSVAADALREDDRLAFWVGVAMEHHRDSGPGGA